MKGVYKYSILEEFRLIIQFYQGDSTLNGLIKLKQEILQDKCYNSGYRILIDNRLARGNSLKVTDIEEYAKWISKNAKSTGTISNVFLTYTPAQTAKSILFSLKKKHKNVSYYVFSTIEGCLKQLNIDISNIEIIENEIKKMRNKKI